MIIIIIRLQTWLSVRDGHSRFDTQTRTNIPRDRMSGGYVTTGCRHQNYGQMVTDMSHKSVGHYAEIHFMNTFICKMQKHWTERMEEKMTDEQICTLYVAFCH